MSTIHTIVVFIIAVGLLVTVHEFGHFWVARRCGVKVIRFSVGFGKALWRRTDKKGTEFVIAAIPLGGYVKMLDERAEEVEPHLRSQAFNNKTVGQRAAIIAAGPLANFLFAVFAYWLIFIIGMPALRPVIGEVAPQSIAAQANISAGMELKSVAGIETPDWNAVRMALLGQVGEKRIDVTVAQFGSSVEQKKTLDTSNWAFDPDKQSPIQTLGFVPKMPQVEPVLAVVHKDSAAEKAGLKPGDRLLKVNGKDVGQWQDFVKLWQGSPGRPMELGVSRDGENMTIVMTPEAKTLDNGSTVGFAGISPKVIPLPEEYQITRQYNVFSAVYQAGIETWQLTKLTAKMMVKLITGDVKLKNLSGPVTIAQVAGEAAKSGILYYLMFLALISVNLGIINLFPLPVLDGGHLAFLAVEKVTGKPVSEQVQDYSYRVGAILLVLLMGLALFNDFSRFYG